MQMLHTYIVIGVSSGIGLALVREILDHGGKVIGIGRTNLIHHENYRFFPLDLGDIHAVDSFQLPSLDSPHVLIYNAATLGEIKAFTNQSAKNSRHVFQVNYLSATVLTHLVLENKNCKQILYISSGAAKRAIPSWSQYCASKAALNIFAETLQAEIVLDHRLTVIKSIAPGVVDTKMQEQIRACSEKDFVQVQHFKELYHKKELTTPEEVAKKLIHVTQNIDLYPNVCFSLRDATI